MENIYQLRDDIVVTGFHLLDKGLVAGTWGNISASSNSGNAIAVTPSGRNYRTLRPEDIVIVNPVGEIVEGELIPSSELPLHLAIYKARPDIKAIVHTHSVFASACAVARKPIPAIIEDLVQLAGGSIDVAEYALPGSPALAKHAVLALGNKNAVLLANHGVIGCGRTLSEAMMACELVEKAAQIFIYAKQLGNAVELSNQDITAMHEFYLEHYRKRQEG